MLLQLRISDRSEAVAGNASHPLGGDISESHASLMLRCSSQLQAERRRREELEGQLQKAAENNRALAKYNQRLRQQVDRLRAENELAVHQLAMCVAAFKAREADGTREIHRLQQTLQESGIYISQLSKQLQEKQARGFAFKSLLLSCCLLVHLAALEGV